MNTHANNRRRVHHGGVLFEVVLSVALFGGAAVFALSAARTTLAALERMRLQQDAIDLAKSRMAELEAGIISLADVGSDSQDSDDPIQWGIDVQASRTEFTGLTLVQINVRQNLSAGDDSNPMTFTLRQLVALRGAGE